MKNRNIILGINWEQNSSASLMIENKIVGCSSEERFSKVKNDERYPINAINWLLKEFKVSTLEITSVCFISKVWSPIYILTRHYTNFSMDDYLLEQKKYWYPKIYLNKKISYLKLFKKKIDYRQFPGPDYWNKIVKKLESADYHVSNKKIISYGATYKSTTLFNYCNIDKRYIDYVTDTTINKQGKFTPGKHIPIISPKKGFNESVDYAFLGAWNFKKEILKKEKKFIKRGGKFITHVPFIKILS